MRVLLPTSSFTVIALFAQAWRGLALPVTLIPDTSLSTRGEGLDLSVSEILEIRNILAALDLEDSLQFRSSIVDIEARNGGEGAKNKELKVPRRSKTEMTEEDKAFKAKQKAEQKALKEAGKKAKK
ncbi:hypothetical protein EST38_g14365 [Candolleomyces aberdarensis]|uniref:Uncharacterized protein n=1 Tax=Candolleomyces aberdarensis TaxID=2316362 RepID=A0A4Q2CXG6_9AGAR|nr:hypothetical protein EST38_g14365 [Candolleomyces aberdarensis]